MAQFLRSSADWVPGRFDSRRERRGHHLAGHALIYRSARTGGAGMTVLVGMFQLLRVGDL